MPAAVPGFNFARVAIGLMNGQPATPFVEHVDFQNGTCVCRDKHHLVAIW